MCVFLAWVDVELQLYITVQQRLYCQIWQIWYMVQIPFFFEEPEDQWG